MARKKEEEASLFKFIIVVTLILIAVIFFYAKLIIKLVRKISNLIKKHKAKKENKIYKPSKRKESNLDTNLAATAIGLALSDTSNTESNDCKYSEQELDNYGLTEQEKEEARSGNYEPWDFDEDEIDEDSYYSDDDNEE